LFSPIRIRRIRILSLYWQADGLILQRWRQVEAIAAALLEFNTLTRDPLLATVDFGD